MSDPKLTAGEIVHVRLLASDGMDTDVPFSRKEFDQLSREAAAANMEVGEYIKQKLEKTVTADRAKALGEWATFLRYFDGRNEQSLQVLSDWLRKNSLGMRDSLEAIALALGTDHIATVMAYTDEVVAGLAFARACQIAYRAHEAKIFEDELQRLRERFAEAEADLVQKTSALRSINRDASTERLETRLAEARAAERAAVATELETLRSKVATQQSEIDELRASKKKLREALERAKEKA